MNFRTIIIGFVLTIASTTTLSAQQDARHPGIILYEQGKHQEAVDSLKKAVSKDPVETIRYSFSIY